MKNILVTGASGFIAKHLLPELYKKNYKVKKITRKDGNIQDAITWKKLPKYDVVIHLSGRTFVPDSWKNPSEFIDTNVNGVIQALNYCKKNNSKLIYISSYLYGNAQKIPISERERVKVTNPYTLSKKLAEDVCECYYKNFGVNILILRPFNVFGPNQKEHFLIPSIMKQILLSKKITVNDLNPKRDFVYIKDLVDAIIKTINLKKKFEIFNIASGKSYSVREVIKIIQEVKDMKLKIKSSKKKRKDEIMDTKANITKSRKILNWKPKWTFKKGIADIYESN